MGLENLLPNQYLRAFVLFVILFLVIRIIVFGLERIFKKITAKTKTDADDVLLKKTSKPITVIIFLLGLNIALRELILPKNIENILINVLWSISIIFFSYICYIILDVLILRGWRKISKKTKSEIDDALVSIIKGILKALLIALSIIYILEIWGVQIGPFIAGLGIGGLAVALALQPSLANIFGGASMILDKSVRVGDVLLLEDGTMGKVTEVGLRSTKITSFDHELIIIPNTKLADSKIQNVALPEPKTRVAISFGVAYGTNIEKLKKIVLSEIKKIPHFISNPEPVIRFLEMGSSSLNFKTYFFVDHFEHRANAIDEANTRIYNALNKNNISIPFPQMDIHVFDKSKTKNKK